MGQYWYLFDVSFLPIPFFDIILVLTTSCIQRIDVDTLRDIPLNSHVAPLCSPFSPIQPCINLYRTRLTLPLTDTCDASGEPLLLAEIDHCGYVLKLTDRGGKGI